MRRMLAFMSFTYILTVPRSCSLVHLRKFQRPRRVLSVKLGISATWKPTWWRAEHYWEYSSCQTLSSGVSYYWYMKRWCLAEPARTLLSERSSALPRSCWSLLLSRYPLLGPFVGDFWTSIPKQWVTLILHRTVKVFPIYGARKEAARREAVVTTLGG